MIVLAVYCLVLVHRLPKISVFFGDDDYLLVFVWDGVTAAEVVFLQRD